mmetsp:Transcript_24346/g.58042  ORF Transcript_24346/g.58042 Transcript_24346/m.58042 type:complete len:222 (-) Transcript_24346:482-1147(-)
MSPDGANLAEYSKVGSPSGHRRGRLVRSLPVPRSHNCSGFLSRHDPVRTSPFLASSASPQMCGPKIDLAGRRARKSHASTVLSHPPERRRLQSEGTHATAYTELLCPSGLAWACAAMEPTRASRRSATSRAPRASYTRTPRSSPAVANMGSSAQVARQWMWLPPSSVLLSTKPEVACTWRTSPPLQAMRTFLVSPACQVSGLHLRAVQLGSETCGLGSPRV